MVGDTLIMQQLSGSFLSRYASNIRSPAGENIVPFHLVIKPFSISICLTWSS
uniref:Uncharacterized protein n=1 Tax=Anguilla anguilla TaxID=7936 RepID=A0A0E9UE42_ANGAN